LAVLGFGDRSFPAYCAFARDVAAAAQAKGWPELLPQGTIDRQSPQDFARWGRALGDVLGFDLELSHQPVQPQTTTLTLVSRRDYGTEVQAPTAILRFALPHASLWQRLLGGGFARFQAGDLIGILPKGGDRAAALLARLRTPRRLHRDRREETPRRPQLRPAHGAGAGRHRRSLPPPQPGVPSGAGSGAADPDRRRHRHRAARGLHARQRAPQAGSPVLRHAPSRQRFFYGEELATWQDEGRLSSLVTAVSRGARPHYVQDALRGEATQVADLIRSGARVMVCGGRDMAAGVAEALAEILEPAGLTPAVLKAEGRYAEDVY
jgi:sulfite reductase (NADPH) flavoprotein alpha-component